MQIVQASLDLSGMNDLLEGIQEALIGTGRDEEADAQVLVRQHAKLLAWECSRQLSPKNAEVGRRKIKSDLMKVFHPMATKAGKQWKLLKGDKAGNGEVRWLYAGPTYLIGVRNQDYIPNASDTEMESIYNNRGRGNAARTIAWQDQGPKILGTKKYKASHGKQHVFILNRITVAAARFNAFMRKVASRIGRMRATFAYAASKLGMTDIPQWISSHFESVAAEGKAVFDDSAMSDQKHPSILFGSRAPGIDKFRPEIEDAIKVRQYKMKQHLQLILSGYSSDVKKRISPRRYAKKNRTI